MWLTIPPSPVIVGIVAIVMIAIIIYWISLIFEYKKLTRHVKDCVKDGVQIKSEMKVPKTQREMDHSNDIIAISGACDTVMKYELYHTTKSIATYFYKMYEKVILSFETQDKTKEDRKLVSNACMECMNAYDEETKQHFSNDFLRLVLYGWQITPTEQVIERLRYIFKVHINANTIFTQYIYLLLTKYDKEKFSLNHVFPRDTNLNYNKSQTSILDRLENLNLWLQYTALASATNTYVGRTTNNKLFLTQTKLMNKHARCTIENVLTALFYLDNVLIIKHNKYFTRTTTPQFANNDVFVTLTSIMCNNQMLFALYDTTYDHSLVHITETIIALATSMLKNPITCYNYFTKYLNKYLNNCDHVGSGFGSEYICVPSNAKVNYSFDEHSDKGTMTYTEGTFERYELKMDYNVLYGGEIPMCIKSSISPSYNTDEPTTMRIMISTYGLFPELTQLIYLLHGFTFIKEHLKTDYDYLGRNKVSMPSNSTLQDELLVCSDKQVILNPNSGYKEKIIGESKYATLSATYVCREMMLNYYNSIYKHHALSLSTLLHRLPYKQYGRANLLAFEHMLLLERFVMVYPNLNNETIATTIVNFTK